MLRRHSQNDYQPVTRSRASRALASKSAVLNDRPARSDRKEIRDRLERPASPSIAQASESATTFLKRGHAISYAALFAFTIVLYSRPAELYPSPLTASMALAVGLLTLIFFIPTQYAIEGRISAPITEVKLVLLLGLAGFLSVPFAINRLEAWQEFSGTFIRCIVIFVVMVNVVRTEARLKGLLFLTLAISVWLSFGAINDYRLGLMTVEGYRAGGRGGGIFGNSNDMALHLVTVVPFTVALVLGSRSFVRKAFFVGCALVMIAAIVLTYSRGGFLGLMVALGFLGWKLGHKHRLEIFGCGLVIVIGFLLVAPGGYGLRLASIFFPNLDPVGSSDARRGELIRSLYVALRHPILGIGMGNYGPEMSYRGLVTHNSYTQVAAEMGMAALACYVMFIVKPLKKLAQIARETSDVRSNSQFYYLAIGLQASLLGYMVSSFFASVAYLWYVFYLVGYAVCLRRLYEAETGKQLVVESRKERKEKALRLVPSGLEQSGAMIR